MSDDPGRRRKYYDGVYVGLDLHTYVHTHRAKNPVTKMVKLQTRLCFLDRPYDETSQVLGLIKETQNKFVALVRVLNSGET